MDQREMLSYHVGADGTFKAPRRRHQSPVRIPPTPVLTEATAFT